jgi:hypothetical protein
MLADARKANVPHEHQLVVFFLETDIKHSIGVRHEALEKLLVHLCDPPRRIFHVGRLRVDSKTGKEQPDARDDLIVVHDA